MWPEQPFYRYRKLDAPAGIGGQQPLANGDVQNAPKHASFLVDRRRFEHSSLNDPCLGLQLYALTQPITQVAFDRVARNVRQFVTPNVLFKCMTARVFASCVFGLRRGGFE